ncbi:putative amidoligase enzyme-domain-containing protein [Dichotomopilus funicola]|uniref:Amidoligase enzyme-domain-containing protein n=1 Tax=Dichotomopilus funicola TaxID=1934379 RepID=A0AAN6ZK63_9PEZI|nr:putative amidoligase enzyme-domain-containing protein [Dichotomopilus funicola]
MSGPGNNATRAAAPAGPKPLFGVEIEVYVRLLPAAEARVDRMGNEDAFNTPDYWLDWDTTFDNDTRDHRRLEAQRFRTCKAIKGIIDATLGPRNGWKCESDASLREWELRDPPHARKWYGVEIISPPMSVGKRWQSEIQNVFTALGEYFDFWTNKCCSCHVHVSPGPTRDNSYSLPQLVKRAKAAYFWESALFQLMPGERRMNRYAYPNHHYVLRAEYASTFRNGWDGVFSGLEGMATSGKDAFVYHMKNGSNPTRYMSTNFDPVNKYGTVELRRQAGAASPQTVIRRVLLALTLHISAMRYDFDGVRNRRTRPDGEELIKELAGCIKKLPKTCHGSRFVGWLKWCRESYNTEDEMDTDNVFSEKEINQQERKMRRGDDVVPLAPGEAAPRRRAAPSHQTTLPERPAGSRPPRNTNSNTTGNSTGNGASRATAGTAGTARPTNSSTTRPAASSSTTRPSASRTNNTSTSNNTANASASRTSNGAGRGQGQEQGPRPLQRQRTERARADETTTRRVQS